MQYLLQGPGYTIVRFLIMQYIYSLSSFGKDKDFVALNLQEGNGRFGCLKNLLLCVVIDFCFQNNTSLLRDDVFRISGSV
jgi:hypothetical protein